MVIVCNLEIPGATH